MPIMNVNFFDDPSEGPRAREDVRFNRLGLYVYPDLRRLAVGFDITPFRERPSIEVRLTNAKGERAGILTVIETLDHNFHLTLHLRDREPTDSYSVVAVLYYATPETGRTDVHTLTTTIDVTEGGQEYSVSGS